MTAQVTGLALSLEDRFSVSGIKTSKKNRLKSRRPAAKTMVIVYPSHSIRYPLSEEAAAAPAYHKEQDYS